MYWTEFKKITKQFVDIEVNEKPIRFKRGRYRRLIPVDTRTSINDRGHYVVHTIAKSGNQIFIVCPYCNEVHCHGRGEGYRGPHCDKKIEGMKDYYIVCD